jgi:type VI secretion system protein VasJ
MASPQDAQRELRNSLQRLGKVAAYLWEEDRMNPLAYRLNRTAWLQVAELPPVADGRTRLPPPDGRTQKTLAECRERGDWEGLLRTAEPMVGRFLLWLDLNRHVIEAMGHLGSQYETARDTVCEETASLIGRLPGVEDLAFSDGTPFADSETQSWLQDMTRDQRHSGKTLSVSQEMSASLKNGEAARTEREHALNLLKGGKLLEAIDLLEKRMHDASSRKEKMYWRLALAELLLQSKKTRLVVPHLVEILHDIDQYRLEEWDPRLTLKALKTVWFGLKAQKDQTAKGRATEALNRIARIDLKEAIRLEKGG